MKTESITIRTRKGRIITRRAAVTDWLSNDGRQSSTAQVGIHLYRVVERNSDGPIWAVSKE